MLRHTHCMKFSNSEWRLATTVLDGHNRIRATQHVRVVGRGLCASARCTAPMEHQASLAGSNQQMYSREHFGTHTNTYVFHTGAYGIPKPRPRREGARRTKPAHQSKGLLAPIADFFLGTNASTTSRAQGGTAKEGNDDDDHDTPHPLPSSLAYLHGKGLQSAIRSDGRIVKTRLQSKDVGEDAYFLKNDAMGVADGVGGWASRTRADASLFSRLLMHFCYAELYRQDQATQASWDAQEVEDAQSAWFNCHPVDIMQTAWERCVRASKREGILGSATALMAVLRGDELRIANMGDCVLVLIRDGELLFRSAEQQHSFNFPLQLGMMDATIESVTLSSALCMHRSGMIPDGATDYELPDVNEKMSDYIHSYDHVGSQTEFDTPKNDAGHWALKVQPGDLVIMASDGLFDNLFDDEILDAVHDVMALYPPDDLQAMQMHLPGVLSEKLCHMARGVMDDPRTISSPFQQHANEEGIYYVGGKNDDVTVVIGIISEQSDVLGSRALSSSSPPDDARQG